jgi:hypothetical protein
VLSRTHGGVAMSTAALSRAAHDRPVVTFLGHLGAMTLAMFVGMFGFGLALSLAAGLAGQQPRVAAGLAAGAVHAWDGVCDERDDGRLDASPAPQLAAGLGDDGGDVRAGGGRARLLLGGRDNRRPGLPALLRADDPGDGGRDAVPAGRLHDAARPTPQGIWDGSRRSARRRAGTAQPRREIE